MKLSAANFLTHIKALVTGGGRKSDGTPEIDAGFLKRAEGVGINSVRPATITALTYNLVAGTANNALQALADGTTWANDVAAVRNNFADLAAKLEEVRALLAGTADETNAKVLKVEEAVDTVGTIVWTVPRDYDEATDQLTVRVLASQLASSTDNDVQLDSSTYIKTAGTALGSDVSPVAPSTVLDTEEKWVEFDLGGLGLSRDDVVNFVLKTNGANDTDTEEVLIHDIEFVYRSCLVSYHELDADGNPTLR